MSSPSKCVRCGQPLNDRLIVPSVSAHVACPTARQIERSRYYTRARNIYDFLIAHTFKFPLPGQKSKAF